MPGVDFVISALFETSGLRSEGDCAETIVFSNNEHDERINEQIKYFTALILLRW